MQIFRTHRRSDQLEQIILQRVPLDPREVGLVDRPALAFEQVEVGQAGLGERRQVDLLDSPRDNVRGPVSGVQVEEVAEFAVDDPLANIPFQR